MTQPDAFAPPKSVVADVDTESTTPKIPTLFKVLLILFFVIEAVGRIATGEFGGLVWIGVMAIAGWQTLKGHRAASRVLGVMLILVAAALAFSAMNAFMRGQSVSGAVAVGIAVYLGVLAAYLFLHPAMQAVFRRADSKKWSG